MRISTHMVFCKSHREMASELLGEALVPAVMADVLMARHGVRLPHGSDDDSSDADSVDMWDTPHSSHTRLRRHETKSIFIRDWRVGTIAPEPADTPVSLKEGRLVRAGEPLSAGADLRVLTRSAADFDVQRRKEQQTVGGSALSLISVTSWRFRGDTDASWVTTKSLKGPLRIADGRTKEALYHTTTQPHCALVCLPY